MKKVYRALATMSWCRGDVKSDAVVLSMRRLWLSMNGHKQSCRTLHRCQHFPQQPQPIGGDHDMWGTMIFLRCRLHGKQIEFLDDNQRKLYRTARRSRIRPQNGNLDFEGISLFRVVGFARNLAQKRFHFFELFFCCFFEFFLFFHIFGRNFL